MADSTATTLLLAALLSLVPLLLLTATSFAKIAIVLSLLRNALGTPEVPSGAIVTALALVLSAYVMAPIARDASALAAPALARVDPQAPLSPASRAALAEAAGLALPPLRAFLKRNTAASEQQLFIELARKAAPGAEPPTGDELPILLPSFLLTELSEAFQVGVLILLPFVVIDLVVAAILATLGLATLTPGAVALPLKLLLFVLVDGLSTLSRALVAGYR
jgi:type III secretion protein R